MLTSQDGIEAARSAITWQARLPAAREQPFTKSERTPRHTHTTKNETRWFLTIAELSKNKLIILNRGTTGSQESTKNCTKTFIWWQVQLLRTNMPRAQRRLFRRTETRADCSLCDLAQHVTWNTTSCTDRHRTLRGSISSKTATKSWRQTSEHPHNAISASRQSPQTEKRSCTWCHHTAKLVQSKFVFPTKCKRKNKKKVSFTRALHSLWSVTSGLRRPSPLTLRRGPRGYFRSECCTGGESMAARKHNCLWNAAYERIPRFRAIPRLYDARGKKQLWRPLRANLLYWRKYLRHCWDFSAPGVLCPLRYAPAAIKTDQHGTSRAVRPAGLRCRTFLVESGS